MNDLWWWAYIHYEDRKIHLKKHFVTPQGYLSDLEIALMEYHSGLNPFIFAITPELIPGDTEQTAYANAVNRFWDMGLCVNGEGRWDRAVQKRKHRFELLDIE